MGKERFKTAGRERERERERDRDRDRKREREREIERDREREREIERERERERVLKEYQESKMLPQQPTMSQGNRASNGWERRGRRAEIIHFYLSDGTQQRKADVIHYGSKNTALMAPGSLDGRATFHKA